VQLQALRSVIPLTWVAAPVALVVHPFGLVMGHFQFPHSLLILACHFAIFVLKVVFHVSFCLDLRDPLEV